MFAGYFSWCRATAQITGGEEVLSVLSVLSVVPHLISLFLWSLHCALCHTGLTEQISFTSRQSLIVTTGLKSFSNVYPCLVSRFGLENRKIILKFYFQKGKFSRLKPRENPIYLNLLITGLIELLQGNIKSNLKQRNVTVNV